MTIANSPPADAAGNPIVIEIVRHALQAITDEIEIDITQTAYSPLVFEYKDFAVGLVDAQGQLIAQCRGGVPIFLANVLSEAVRDGLEIYGLADIEEGDVLLTNYAGTTGQHLNHLVTYAPVFSTDRSEILAFSVILVHCVDIGGWYVGSIGSRTTNVFQEGTQIRTVKLERRGEPVPEIYRIVEHNTRFPEMVSGDLAAQIAGCTKAAELFRELLAKYGDRTVMAAIATIWDQTEAEVRRAVERIPDGTYRATSLLDDDGIDLDRRIVVDVTVEVRGDQLTVDFSNVSGEVRGPFNSGRQGGGITAARIAFRYLTTPGDMTNEGSFRALRVVLPEGRFLSASPRAARSGYSIPLPTVIDTIMRTVAEAVPERTAAGHHANFGTHLFVGAHPYDGALFSHIDTALGGWGAWATGDGGGPFKTLAHADTHDIPIEVVEALYPMTVDYLALRRDSGGAGRHRGGLGVDKRYTVQAACEVNIWIERTQCPPWGLDGGLDGQSGRAVICRGGQEPGEIVLKASDLALQPGDTVAISSGSGGGWGLPAERALESVADDVAQGYVTESVAVGIYRVAIVNGEIDHSETRRLRSVAMPESEQ
jgi:N-methylhydantoinase B